MTREYFEAISHKSLIDMAVILSDTKEVYSNILRELSERVCLNCKHYDGVNCNKVSILCLEDDFSCNKWVARDE